jgi:NAD(P)-dependent dehydrogenase (short-subunit alcohol dehydrogenase family)/acyl carrier protein
LKQEGRQVLEVTLGDSFSVLGNDCYQIDGSEAHYEKLLLMLEEKPIDKIIFMVTLALGVPITSLKRLQQSQTGGAYNLFHLTKMLLKHYSTEKIEYVVIADFANKVTGKEKKLKPENAPLLGLAYAIDRECENFSAWCIDIDDTVNVDRLMAEIRAGKQYRAAAYRENRRYIERFIPIDIEDIEDSKIEIKNSGVYLITGGTGGIGLEMGKYLASKTKGVNIALVNRSKMPDRDRWEDILDEEADKRTVQKIKAIKEIEAMGAGVCLFSADCSGFRQMKQVLAELRERFGKINGIIHGAGVEGEGLLVRKSEKKFTNVLNPKVAGTWILDRLTKDDNLDFLVLFSTVATFLMNPGQTDYTAANAYLDTFSEYRNRQGKKTLAVNWVTWKETGMAVNFNANFDIIFKAIPTAQAVGAFDVVLNKKVNRVLIGELNLDSKLINLLKNAQFRLAAPIRNIIDAPDTPLKAQSADEQRKKIRKVKLTGREDGAYTKSELLVAKVWGEVLGFDELRIDDNFYELGGDSILATQVVNRINTENNLKISLIEIFNYETIKDLAKYVESLS